MEQELEERHSEFELGCVVGGAPGHPGGPGDQELGSQTGWLASWRGEEQPAAPVSHLCLLVPLSGGLLWACEVPSVRHFYLPAAKLMLERTTTDGTWVGLAHTVVTSSRSRLVLSRSPLLDPGAEASGGADPAGVQVTARILLLGGGSDPFICTVPAPVPALTSCPRCPLP